MSTVQLPMEEEKRVDDEMEAWVDDLLNESSCIDEQSLKNLEEQQPREEEEVRAIQDQKISENGVRFSTMFSDTTVNAVGCLSVLCSLFCPFQVDIDYMFAYFRSATEISPWEEKTCMGAYN